MFRVREDSAITLNSLRSIPSNTRARGKGQRTLKVLMASILKWLKNSLVVFFDVLVKVPLVGWINCFPSSVV